MSVYCRSCELFLQPHEIDRERSTDAYEYFGERGTRETFVEVCAVCREEIDDIASCEECHSAKPMPGGDFCKACAARIDEEEQVLLAIVKAPLMLRRRA